MKECDRFGSCQIRDDLIRDTLISDLAKNKLDKFSYLKAHDDLMRNIVNNSKKDMKV